MDSQQNGRRPRAYRPGEEHPSLYASVIYLPPPLGGFLDQLRLEMIPGCNPHAHVSVLPPRTLPVGAEAAVAQARLLISGFVPFDIVLGGIEKFDVTDVIYIRVEQGGDQLRRIHAALNTGALSFPEPFAYHPHVTLAQDIEDGRVEELVELAARRWREFPGPRSFRAERVVFVRNSRGNVWVDLAGEEFRGAPVGPVG